MAARKPPRRTARPARAAQEASPTEVRLLEAAAQVFAERGYDGATVREVVRRARANVAAVNYHYGGKQALYAATLRWAARLEEGGARETLLELARRADLPPGERLEQVVALLARTLLAPQPQWHRRLLLNEMAAPTEALGALVREAVAPVFAALAGVVAPFLPGADPERLRLTVMSIVGQVLYHRVAAPVALTLLEQPAYDEALVGRVAAHIARFTRRSLEHGAAPAQGAPARGGPA